MINKVNDILISLKHYCEKEEYKGWDPFDGLNSKVFKFTGLNKFRLPRLLWMQFFKRSPINFRKISLVEKGVNPQAIGLFLSAYVRLYNLNKDQLEIAKIEHLYSILEKIESKGWSGSCWGYNFDWQARAFYQPAYTPTVVPTIYAAQGILDYYELTGDKKLLEKCLSVCLFLTKDLNRTYGNDGSFAFSYSPLDSSVVYNISLHISNFLARVYSITGNEEFKDIAGKLAEYCCFNQHENGSWSYGKKEYHGWIDSFHTGYNLECLHGYSIYSGDFRFEDNLKRGFEFYRKEFIDKNGRPLYYVHKDYPFDINSAAQFIVTLSKLGKLNQQKDMADKSLNWVFDHLFSQKDYFYFRKTKYFTNKVPYMRWSQAWMMYALVMYLEGSRNES